MKNETVAADGSRAAVLEADPSVSHWYAALHVAGPLDPASLRTAWRTAVSRVLGAGAGAGTTVHFTDRTAPPLPAPGGPVVCLHAVRLAAEEHGLLPAARRDAVDGGDFARLLDALAAGYGAAAGTPPDTDPLRSAAPGNAVRFDWGAGIRRRAAALAAVHGTVPAAVVLAAFRALLHRHRGDHGDISFRELLDQWPLPPSAAGLALRSVTAYGAEETPGGLHLELDGHPSSVGGALRYGVPHDARSAECLLEQAHVLLDAALDDPCLTIGRLPLETPDRLLAALRDADRLLPPGSGPRPVHLLVGGDAGDDAPAVEWDGRAVGYGALRDRADRIARHLLSRGARDGATVAVRMPPGDLRVAVLIAVMASGARLLWLGTGAAGERNRAMLRELRPVCMVLDGDGDGDELAGWYVRELGGRLLDAARARRTAAPADAPAPAAARPDRHAYVAFTSGSTGRPKGIPQTHAALAQFAQWLGRQFAMGPGARVAQWVAPEHDPALCEVFATLVAGGTLCPVPDRVRANPDRLVPWLAQQRITHIQTVPSFARDLLTAVADGAERPGSLRHVLLMGEALRGDLVNDLRDAFPGVRVANLYGPTETIAATWHEAEGTERGTVPIGRPIPGRQVLVLDGDDRPCPAGVTGEIVIHSPYVTDGYLGTADRSAFRPVEALPGTEPGARADAGWYRTGDLARRRWDGALEFRGRKDFQVKVFGNRVELTEIEAALASHPSVHECAVVPQANESGLVTRLTVYVVPHRGADGTGRAAAREWRAHLRRHFGPLTLPATFREVPDRLPRNAAGKIDRSRLPGAARPD
ncbi:amino acid adenylation domain-containing protein [Streptomyces desertarenae]|uniref:Amino acid adenylation domain-containing protein n=1 Tax=Streptomyces desertarenae TaxID=2666184 RepID=A0ABW4PTH9_9ACTN